MRFDITQRFTAPVEEVLTLYTDPDFHASIPGNGKIEFGELVERSADGSTVRLRIRYRFVADLPAAARRILRPEKLTWVEDSTYDLDEQVAKVTIVPDHYPDRLQASATARFTPQGDGALRKVSGELKVRAMLVAGKVEKVIVDGMREQLATEETSAAARLS